MKRLLFILTVLLITTSCDQFQAIFGNGNTSSKTEDPNLIKRYYDNGKLKSAHQVNELRQKHGVAKMYSKDGKLLKSFEYENGEKRKAISYYKNGQPLMEINYKNDVKDGLFKRYYDTGQLESEIPYKENYAGKGLKEYTKSGKLKTQYPELVVKGIDLLRTKGQYIIEVYFDKNPGRGTYYVGDLTENTYLNYSLDELPRTNYRGRMTLSPPPGALIMEKLNFVGEYKTPTGNKYIVEKTFNLAIDNTL